MANRGECDFRPAMDAFYLCLGAVPLLAVLLALIVDVSWTGAGPAIAMPPALVFLAVLVLLLLSGLVLGTRYSLREAGLFVQFAFFSSVTIPYADITSVDIVNSVQASAALSRRRIRITWKDPSVPWERRRDISPRDEAGLLALLRQRVTPQAWHIEAGGTSS